MSKTNDICPVCKGTGETPIQLPALDKNGRPLGYSIPSSVKCKSCNGTGKKKN